jgi:uncharacterized RDD family membrane protein YckC
VKTPPSIGTPSPRLFVTALLLLLAGLAPAQDAPPAEPAKPAEPATTKPAAKPAESVAEEIFGVPVDEPGPATRGNGRHRQKYTYRELVVLGNDAALREGENAREMVVVGGSAVVDGTVHYDLVVVGGKLKLGPKAEVKRDLVLVFSEMEADPGAKIHGQRTVVGGALGVLTKPLIQWPQQWFRKGLMWARPLPHQYPWAWAVAGATLLLYLALATVFPRPLQAVAATLENRAGAALLAGLLGVVLIPFVLFLLTATGVGIVAAPFALCAAVLAFIFGKVAVYQFAGRQLGAQTGVGFLQKPLAALVAGTLLFFLLYAVPILGFIVWGAVAPLALGAVLLAAFQRAPRANGQGPAADSGGAVPVQSAATASEAGVTPSASAAQAGLWPRAGFWWRMLATLLDLVLIGLVAAVVFQARKFFLLFWVAYLLSLWSWKGTTVGGLICHLRIVHTDGRPIGFAAALLRLLGSFFSLAALGLGFFWAGWSRDKQSWHDKMAGTVIVHTPLI